MIFDLTKEQSLLKETVRKLAEKEIKPLSTELDRTGRFPEENIKKLRAMNLLGITIPEKYCGAGLDNVSYAIAIEEIARACASTAVIMAVHNSLVCNAIFKYGTESQKEKYLKPAAKGEILGSFCLTEPEAGSDAANIKTQANLQKEQYILNGHKIFITNGMFADIFLVVAVSDRQKGTKGFSIFIVERGTPGFTVQPAKEKLGINASGTAEIIMENCPVSKENLLGGEGNGFKLALSLLDESRIGIAAQAVGIAVSAFEEAMKFATLRVQFGKPISSFQSIQWMLADMAMEIDAARLLTYKAAWLLDQGKRISKEAAMAKLYASEVANRAATKALQIHGGYGYTKEFIVERIFRDARITQIYEGTSEIQRKVIASQLLKEIQG